MLFVRVALHGSLIAALTVVTQLGGIAWAIALLTSRKLLTFVAAYAVLWLGATLTAPMAGRVPMPCASAGPTVMQSWLYCGLNRHYASPELKQTLEDLGTAMDDRFPGTRTLVLDANFPFLDGFRLLPHRSHDDGEKADLAFFYQNEIGYLPGATRSPIGYFAFEQGPSACPQVWPTFRWDLEFLQPLWPDYGVEPQRMRFALNWLAGDPRVGKIFLEPHLRDQLGVSDPKVRFQGCNAARHDDHIHIQQ